MAKGKITGSSQTSKVHPWYDHAVFYQIYPLSFKDSDGNGRGDIPGIISKVDYLEWLGITAVWLSPVNASSMKDFGYDVVDYCAIDPRFGTLEDFDELISKLHEKGIRIILDFVINHTSSDHPWFLESSSSRDNPKRDWYIWKDPSPKGGPPNNWRNISLGSEAWTFDEKTGQYYFHQFLRHQPDLNWRNPEVVAEMTKVLEFWMKRGIDGFRVDALEHVIEALHLKDEPSVPARPRKYNENDYALLDHIYTRSQPELKEVISLLSQTAHNHGDAFIVNEVYAPPEKLAEFYKLSPYKNTAPFNFSLIELPWERNGIKNAIDRFESKLLPDDVRTYALGNHDVPRLATRIGPKNIRIAAMLLLTLPGSPFIYYGEELGMRNATLSAEDIKDTFDFGNFSRDQVRTPMPWNTSMGLGFTTGEPWLPFAGDFEKVNVESEKNDPHSMLSLYRELIDSRKNIPALLHGTYRSLHTSSKDLYAYVREFEGQKIAVVLNFSNKAVSEDLEGCEYELISSTNLDREKDFHISGNLTLEPHEGLILRFVK